MRGTLEILIGPSGVGKSTYAREAASNNSNVIVVNRDKIRELLFGYSEDTVTADKKIFWNYIGEFWNNDNSFGTSEKVPPISGDIVLE